MPQSDAEASTLDPKLRALEVYLNAGAKRLLERASGSHQNGLLFLSAWHESMPALVHLDPILEPVDSRVFAVLWICAKQEGHGSIAFPSYDLIAERCNVRSRGTVARALAILRATRWITLCRRVRENGRNRGNIYALHDEPLALTGTRYLDPTYMTFLEHAAHHGHDRVAGVSRTVLANLRSAIDWNDNITAEPIVGQLGQRIEAVATVSRLGMGHYFGFRRDAIAAFRRERTGQAEDSMIPRRGESERKRGSDRVQNLNSLCSSREKQNKTTTTQPHGERKPESPAGTLNRDRLIFPEALSSEEQQYAIRNLQRIDPELWQPFLDELAEKIRTQAKSGQPVRNPIGLLAWMCGEAEAGRIHLTSAHLKHKERRERQWAMDQRIKEQEQRLTALAREQVKHCRPLATKAATTSRVPTE